MKHNEIPTNLTCKHFWPPKTSIAFTQILVNPTLLFNSRFDWIHIKTDILHNYNSSNKLLVNPTLLFNSRLDWIHIKHILCNLKDNFQDNWANVSNNVNDIWETWKYTSMCVCLVVSSFCNGIRLYSPICGVIISVLIHRWCNCKHARLGCGRLWFRVPVKTNQRLCNWYLLLLL